MIHVAGYCRVSTDREDQTNSFEAQQRYFREYISHHPDWILFDIYADEGTSGTGTKNRHQFNRMLHDARKGSFSLILTKEVSRFSRNILDTVAFTRELRALGVGVRFLLDGIDTMNPDAELHLSIMGSLAQEESRKTSCRVTWGQIRQMERGVVFGHSLLGYVVNNGRLIIEPEGADTVRLIFRKYTLEKYSAYHIARLLSEEKRKTALGSIRWTGQTVLKILKNEKYVGDLTQRKTYTPDFLTHKKIANRGNVPLIHLSDHHEPIISRQLWNLTQKRLYQRKSPKETSRNVSEIHIFSGKIQCGVCGKAFVARYKYRSDGTKLRRWSCGTAAAHGRDRCNIGKLIREDDALQMLDTAIARLCLDGNALLEQTANLILSVSEQTARTHNSDANRLHTLLLQTSRKKEAVMDSYFENLISKEDMLTMCRKYETQLYTLREQLDRLSGEESNFSSTHSDISAMKQIMLETLSGNRKSRLFYRNILQSITVFPDRHIEVRLKDLDTVFHYSEDS